MRPGRRNSGSVQPLSGITYTAAWGVGEVVGWGM